MCGFSGFLSRDICSAEPAERLLRAMAHQLVHRGPDGGGQWSDPSTGVGLCHRRLAILDLTPAGHQPMASGCGRYMIAFNGEIYNHLELRQQLEQAGQAPPWRGHSDTETLLAALAAWGVAATLPRLVGMFALALWDRQQRQLVLARDRFGEKPLYYAVARSSTGQPLLLFGSELPALMVHPGYDRSLDRRATALYLRHAYVPAPWSIHQQTRKLSPGCWLVLGPHELPPSVEALQQREQVYWSALAAAQQGLRQPFAGSSQQAIEAVEHALSSAVARQSLADVPLGAFLSGGIDSSLVVALLQAQHSRAIQTFSMGFEDPEFNEAPYAAAVARHLGTNHTEMTVTGADALAVIPQLPAMYGEPFADSSQIPTSLVARLARQHVTVALSGDAGDEVFGGYNRYVLATALWRKLGRVPRRLRRSVAAGLQSVPAAAWQRLLEPANRLLPAPRCQRNVGEKLHKVASLLSCSSAQELYVRLVSQWPNTDALVVGSREYDPAVLDPELWLQGTELENQMMMLDTLTYLPDDILVKVDRAAMAVGLETRIPMLDPDLFALAWSLPLDQKIAAGRGKLPLRAVLARHLPTELIERPKMGFGVPLASWLRGPLRDWGEALLEPMRLQQQGLLHVEPVQACWQGHQQGRLEGHYQLWPLLMLQAWLDHVEQLPVLQGVV
ncbi:MAG: asparagine synthase (glutamine-hydrolyzing) [Cyanobacteriota bacterium]